jgi:hypothetical protein
MTRRRLAIACLALLGACSATPPAPDATAGGGLPGASPRAGSGAMCIAENQQCDREHRCCAESSCVAWGRFGSLCRRPSAGM